MVGPLQFPQAVPEVFFCGFSVVNGLLLHNDDDVVDTVRRELRRPTGPEQRDDRVATLPLRDQKNQVFCVLKISQVAPDLFQMTILPRWRPDLIEQIEHFGTVTGLTKAEITVMAGLLKGMTLQDISAEQGVSINTVRTHLRQVCQKLGVQTQHQVCAHVWPFIAHLH